MKLRTALFFILDGFLFAIWLTALLLNFAAVALVTFAGWLLYQDGHPWAALLCAVGIVVILVGSYEDLWKDRHIFGEWRRAMKLHTEIVGYPGDTLVIYDADCGLLPDEQAEHDAMAAHALLQAIDDWHEKNGTGPDEDVYPESAVAFIEQRAAEILAGWLGEEV